MADIALGPWKRFPIVSWGHMSNFFKVTQAEKSIWISFEITRLVAAIKSLTFALFHSLRLSVKSHHPKTRRFWPELAFPDCSSSLNPQMARNYVYSLKWHRRDALLFFAVICQISMSHGPKNLTILTRNEHFWTVASDWIHRWLWNDAERMKWHRKAVLLFFEVVCQISWSYRLKIDDFDPNWAFPDSNSSLNSQMATKWCTKLHVA